MKAKYNLTFALLLLLITGCSTTPKANLAKFNQSHEALYPPIAVVMTSENLQYPMHRNAFLTALREAKVFERIEISNPYSDFAMEVNLDLQNKSMQNNAEGLTKVVIASGTLGIIPVSLEFVTKGTIKLRYQGMVFEEFDIQSEYKTNLSIYNLESKDSGIGGAYRKTVEKILEEIQERKPFEELMENLHQMQKPEGIGI